MANLNRITEKGPIKWLVLFLQGVAAVTLFALMMITVIDVTGRYVFNNPLASSTELTEIAMGILVFSVLPIISWRNDHVVVDLLDRFVPAKAHMIRTMLINVLVSATLVYLGSRINVLGERSLDYGDITEYLHIPIGYVIYFIGYMCWITAIMVITLGIFRAWKEYSLHQPIHSPDNPIE